MATLKALYYGHIKRRCIVAILQGLYYSHIKMVGIIAALKWVV